MSFEDIINKLHHHKEASSMLSKQDILEKDDLVKKEIDVPEWGGKVIISTMSGSSMDQFEASLTKPTGGIDNANIRAKLIAATLVDENGNLIFDANDIEKLGKKSVKALDRIYLESKKLNAVGAKEVEDLAKN